MRYDIHTLSSGMSASHGGRRPVRAIHPDPLVPAWSDAWFDEDRRSSISDAVIAGNLASFGTEAPLGGIRDEVVHDSVASGLARQFLRKIEGTPSFTVGTRRTSSIFAKLLANGKITGDDAREVAAAVHAGLKKLKGGVASLALAAEGRHFLVSVHVSSERSSPGGLHFRPIHPRLFVSTLDRRAIIDTAARLPFEIDEHVLQRVVKRGRLAAPSDAFACMMDAMMMSCVIASSGITPPSSHVALPCLSGLLLGFITDLPRRTSLWEGTRRYAKGHPGTSDVPGDDMPCGITLRMVRNHTFIHKELFSPRQALVHQALRDWITRHRVTAFRHMCAVLLPVHLHPEALALAPEAARLAEAMEDLAAIWAMPAYAGSVNWQLVEAMAESGMTPGGQALGHGVVEVTGLQTRNTRAGARRVNLAF